MTTKKKVENGEKEMKEIKDHPVDTVLEMLDVTIKQLDEVGRLRPAAVANGVPVIYLGVPAVHELKTRMEKIVELLTQL